MKNKNMKLLGIALASAVLAGGIAPLPAQAAVDNGWDGEYWYENGVKQGTEGRGKEIWDGEAWYWLDADQDGKKAVNKDLYQESEAGIWAEREDGTGKWVRYDENGHMVKGWYFNENGTYYFDLFYGTMAKGRVTIDGAEYTFDMATGILQDNEAPVQNGWVNIDGGDYWYENGVRQGLEGRGKEIWDGEAWYWLDADENGKKAVGKDVYQESQADDAGNMGKWVRYDENGHMIKGWSEKDGNRYYFDPVYGTMAKGIVTIEGTSWQFDANTGVCLGEYNVETYRVWITSRDETLDENDNVINYSVYEYGENSYHVSKVVNYEVTESGDVLTGITEYERNNEGGLLSRIDTDAAGRMVTAVWYNADGRQTKYLYKRYGNDGSVSYGYTFQYSYDENGNQTECLEYDKEDKLASRMVYDYVDGRLTEQRTYNPEGRLETKTVYTYENDLLKQSNYEYYSYDEDGNIFYTYATRALYSYNEAGLQSEVRNQRLSSNNEYADIDRTVYSYDEDGNETMYISYRWKGIDSTWEEVSRREATYWKHGNYSYRMTSDSYSNGEYSNGYAYERNENARTTKYISYTRNKEINYYTVYDLTESPNYSSGETQYITVDRTYDKNDQLTESNRIIHNLITYTR